jgi:hypothetical protein
MKSDRSGDSANPSSDNPYAFGAHVLITQEVGSRTEKIGAKICWRGARQNAEIKSINAQFAVQREASFRLWEFKISCSVNSPDGPRASWT